jgi:hypothetical protein
VWEIAPTERPFWILIERRVENFFAPMLEPGNLSSEGLPEVLRKKSNAGAEGVGL